MQSMTPWGDLGCACQGGNPGCACQGNDLGAARKRPQIQRVQNVRAVPRSAPRASFQRSAASGGSPAGTGTRPLSAKRAQRQKRRGAGMSGRTLTGQNRRKLRFSKINRGAAKGLGLNVQQAQSGYSYPEIPQQVEEGIPNYYADSRKARMLDDMPPDAGNMARSIGRYIFQSLPDDTDRGDTVEATIANVLDYAANAATRANDAQNAEFLSKVAKRWRKVIGKRKAAIDPDAPIGETAGLGGFLPTGLRATKLPAVAFAAGGFAGYFLGPKKGGGQRALGYGIVGAAAALVFLRVLTPEAD
jgi:hypothetical protein